MAITFFGVATTPADNSGSSLGPTVTLTPPASMVDGDLVYVSVRYRDSAATVATAPSNTGGQTWNATTQYNATNIRARVFWCRFNGTWSANPAFTVTSGTNNIDAQMLVFRPTSATYTWSLESGPNSATYAAPSTPFTVTVTGRTTTAPSNVSIAAWHSVDDNSWGTLSGTGWSKTSLGAQYRNNDTNDNSSTFAYNIQTSAGATNNVSQNQSALGGDAGSTSLFTFAETLVTALPTGVSGTTAAQDLGFSDPWTGITGVESAASAGSPTVPLAGGTNATATPTGAAITAAVGVLVLLVTQVVVPTGVGIGAQAGTASASTSVVVAGASASASAGTITAVGASAGTVPITGVSASAAAGSLGISVPIVGIAGVSAAASAGTAAGASGTLTPGAGQPSPVFATAQVGVVAVSSSSPLVGAQSVATAELLTLTAIGEDVDGGQSAASAGALTVHTTTLVTGVASSAAAGTVSTNSLVSVPISGVSAIATTGNVIALTSGQAVAAPGGVQAQAQAGIAQAVWTKIVLASGAEAACAAGDVVVVGGDSVSTEVFPAGAQAIAQVGTLTSGQAIVSPGSVAATCVAGTAAGVSSATVGFLKADEAAIETIYEASVEVESIFGGQIVVESVT